MTPAYVPEKSRVRRPFPLDFGAPGKRHDVLDAALLEFLEHTYFGTDTNRIARRAGTALATVYHHFSDKLAIFLAVYDGWARYELARFKELTARLEKGDSVDQVGRAITAWLVKSCKSARNIHASLGVLVRTEKLAAEAHARRQKELVEWMRQMLLSKGRDKSFADIEAALAIINSMLVPLCAGDAVSRAASAIIEEQIVRVLRGLLDLN